MELKAILEAILFSAQKPLSPAELRDLFTSAPEHAENEVTRAFKKTKVADIEAALAQLEQEHAQAGRAFRLVCVAGSWQFVSQPEYAPWIKALLGARVRPPRLTQPALETLAIIAYRQPITRAEMEQIRGVSVDGVLQTLLERGLVEAVGRAEVVGRPITYGTTRLFLEYFGLRSLQDLPAGEDLRRIPVQRPETLPTAEPGLATAPPEQLSLEAALGQAPAGTAAPAATPAAVPGSATPATAESPGGETPKTDEPGQ